MCLYIKTVIPIASHRLFVSNAIIVYHAVLNHRIGTRVGEDVTIYSYNKPIIVYHVSDVFYTRLELPGNTCVDNTILQQ